MNIILVGASGYFGSKFAGRIVERGHRLLTVTHYEIKSAAQFSKYITANRSDVVLNCAAFVARPSVELNDKHKRETLTGNLLLPALIKDACEFAQTPMLHVSTGCLFRDVDCEPGKAEPKSYRKFSEFDAPDLTFDKGAGWYVGSKQMAEEVVGEYSRAWICRVRLPFDNVPDSRNFLTKLLSFPKLVDVRNSMSHRGDFVDACLDMVERGVPFGVYNMSNPGAIWPHEIAEIAVQNGLKHQFEYFDWGEFLSKYRITPMSYAELDVSKLLATGIAMRPIREAIEDSLDRWVWEKK
jgi:dTDP-4-dehydrorhamnose reductase